MVNNWILLKKPIIHTETNYVSWCVGTSEANPSNRPYNG